jgi:hypothetical protein
MSSHPTAARAGLPGTQLGNPLTTSVDGDADQVQVVDGQCEVPVLGNQWTWLCAADKARRGTRYVHVAPFEGVHTETIVFAAPRRGVHVFVYDATLTKMQENAEIELAPCIPGGRGTTGDPIWHGRADALGHAFAEADREGPFVARLCGVPPSADGAATGMVVLSPAVGLEAVVMLAMPEAGHRCLFHLRSESQGGLASAAWLLARVDAERECVVPLSLPTNGLEKDVEALLPAGRFQPLVSPQGLVQVHGAEAGIEVQAGGRNEWTLTLVAGPQREVQLLGLNQQDLPVVVRWVADDDLLETAEPHTWIGPPRWNRLHESVPSSGRAARLFVESRLGRWTSDVVPESGPAGVSLQNACLVEVHAPMGRRTELVAEVEHRLGTMIRLMRPALMSTPGGRRPELRAALPVPSGALKVRVRDAQGGVLLERSVVADEAHLAISL